MASNTIVLKPRGAEHDEFIASGVCKPGHLLVTEDASGICKVKKHATAVGQAERMFAKEDSLQGKTIADQYAIGDLVMVCHGKPGTELQARLPAGAVTINFGTLLTSNGDGTLKVSAAPTTDRLVAVSAMNLGAVTATVDQLIDVRLL